VGAAAWYFNAEGSAKPSAAAGGAQAPVTVSVVSPQRQDVPVLLQANGTVTPISSVDLHPQTTRTIAKVHIREGQFVRQGELMFSLDARTEQANVDKAQAQVVRDRAALADVERQYKRSMELLGRGFVAQGAVDTLKSDLDSARALLSADIAAVRAAQVDASHTVIRAPMAGRVGAIPVYAGTLVQLTSSLATITQLHPIDVAFTLPESNLTALLAAQKAGSVAVSAVQGEGGKPVQGQLSFIDNTVDPVAGVIRVKARFDNKDTQLWPGQYVHTRLTVQTLKDAFVIPQNAIISNTSGVFVYSMEGDGGVKVRNIQRLHSFGANAAVSGLTGSEKIIVDGKQNLRPGSRVVLAQLAGEQQNQQHQLSGQPGSLRE
jgi:RND family efflux transporter MFP subunit